MKSYFTICLPVERDGYFEQNLKVGQFILDNTYQSNGKRGKVGRINEILWKNYLLLEDSTTQWTLKLSDWTKGWPVISPVKLFLCSRDIQVDDTYYWPNGPDPECTLNCNGEEQMDGSEYKVIGEISPEATWVKEEDEFDEDDIDHGGWRDEKLTQIIIKIKGPCGRFH